MIVAHGRCWSDPLHLAAYDAAVVALKLNSMILKTMTAKIAKSAVFMPPGWAEESLNSLTEACANARTATLAYIESLLQETTPALHSTDKTLSIVDISYARQDRKLGGRPQGRDCGRLPENGDGGGVIPFPGPRRL